MMSIRRSVGIVGRGTSSLLFCALASLAALALLEALLRLTNPVPVSPWDAAAIVEASRVADGLPLYEFWTTGHSSWTYGPGMLWLGGLTFQLTGPSAFVLKLQSLGFVIGAVALCMTVLWRWLSPFWRVAAICSFVAIDGRIAYFGVIRPDSMAYCFGFAGLLLSYRGGPRNAVLASVLLVAALLTKQTALMFTVIPPIATLLERKRLNDLVLSALPGIGCCFALVCLKLASPDAWLYMVDEAKYYPILPRDLLKNALAVLSGSTFLWVAIGMNAAGRQSIDGEHGRRLLWTGVALAVTFAGCLVAMSKVGGWINSLAPLYLVLLTFSWLAIAAWLTPGSALRPAPWMRSVVPLALILTLFPIWPSFDPIRLTRSTALADYRQVVAVTKRLPGDVLSPMDPSVTLLSRGQHDGSAILSLDTIGWPKMLPPTLLDRPFAARYIVQRLGWSGGDELDLPGRGYRPFWRNGSYVIWEAPGRETSPPPVERRP